MLLVSFIIFVVSGFSILIGGAGGAVPADQPRALLAAADPRQPLRPARRREAAGGRRVGRRRRVR